MNQKTRIALLVAAAAVIGAGAVGGHRWFIGSIEYSIGQIRRAIETRDLERFRQFVDLEEALTRGARGLIGRESEEQAETLATPDQIDALAQGLISLVEPYIVAQGKTAIERWIKTGETPPPSPGRSRPSPFDPGGFIELSYRGVRDQRQQGESAWATLSFHHRRYDRDLEAILCFRRTDSGRYQLIAVENISELADRLEELEDEWRAEQNRPAAEKIESAVKLVRIEKRTASAGWAPRREVAIWFTLKNLSTRIINRAEGELLIRPKDQAQVLIAAPVVFAEMGLEPGEEGVFIHGFEVAPYNLDHNRTFDTPQDQLTIILELDLVGFEDGQAIEKPYR